MIREPDLILATIRARAEAATHGPWFREYGDVVVTDPDPRDVADRADEPRPMRVVRRADHRGMRDPQGIADAEFISHARTDVPALLAKVERLTAENERLRSAAEQLLVDAKDVPTISMRHVSHVLRAALEPVQRRSGGGTEP